MKGTQSGDYFVIPGPSEARSPESIIPVQRGYEFRTRRFAAIRNDSEGARDAKL